MVLVFVSYQNLGARSMEGMDRSLREGTDLPNSGLNLGPPKVGRQEGLVWMEPEPYFVGFAAASVEAAEEEETQAGSL